MRREPTAEEPGPLVLTWEVSAAEAQESARYVTRVRMKRALLGGLAVVLLSVAVAVSVTGRLDPTSLVLWSLPGLCVLVAAVAWQARALRRAPESLPSSLRLVLGPSGLCLDVDGQRDRRPWGALESITVGAGHVRLHLGRDVWHVPRHVVGDQADLESRIRSLRYRPSTSKAPSRPVEATWTVNAVVTPADWIRHARGRDGLFGALAARFALWRDPDLWPCGPRELVLAPGGGWVDDAAGARAFEWATVSVVEAGGTLCLRTPAAPPILVRLDDLPSRAVVEDVLAWTEAMERGSTLGEPLEGSSDPWAPPRVSRSARRPRSRS